MPGSDEFWEELMNWKETESPLRNYDRRERGEQVVEDDVEKALFPAADKPAGPAEPAPPAEPAAPAAPAEPETPAPAAPEVDLTADVPHRIEERPVAAVSNGEASFGELKVERLDPDGRPVAARPVTDDTVIFEEPVEPRPAATPPRKKLIRRVRRVRRRRGEPDTRDLPESVVGPQDFEVDYDFDEAYEDVEEKPVKRGRAKRTGCLGGLLYFVFVIAVSVALAALGWMCATDVLALGAEDRVVEITLPRSVFTQEERTYEDDDGNRQVKTVNAADMDYVSDTLYNNGLIKYKWLFKLYAQFAKADEKVSAGTYEVNMNYDYRALVNGLTASGGQKVEIEITIPEGYTVRQIVNLLVKNKVCEEEELWDTLANYAFDYDFIDKTTAGDKYRLEGYLFPDTYKFYISDKPVRVINKMLKNFSGKWTAEMSDKAELMGYSMREILTVASMIEKEAGADSERANIASVIYNRLDNPDARTVGLLQIDATILYAMARDDVSGDISTEYDSPYNTYLNKGLPPGPIANPGMASIKAALNPAKTGYFYYALGKEGVHEFFKKYEDFHAFVTSDAYGG